MILLKRLLSNSLWIAILFLSCLSAEAQSFRKENFDERINQLKSLAIGTCDRHGGMNCAAGPNPTDGGITCLDGTKVKLSFADFCTKSKLTSTLYVMDKDSVRRRVSDLRQFFSRGVVYPEFSVMVRNSSAVKALKVRVTLTQGVKTISEAEGEPHDIEAFGGEEFKLLIPPDLFLDRYGLGRGVLLNVSCANC